MGWINLHRHAWQDSAVNPWQVAHEQHCHKCGAYRHRWLDMNRSVYEGERKWLAGQHPKAKELRNENASA